MRLQEQDQIFRKAFGLLGKTGAAVECLTLDCGFASGVQNPVSEVEPNAFREGGPEVDLEHVVVTGGGVVFEPAFEYWESKVERLQGEERLAQVPEELTACLLQDIQVAGVIGVIANGAFGISNAVGAREGGWHHRNYKLRSRGKIEKQK